MTEHVLRGNSNNIVGLFNMLRWLQNGTWTLPAQLQNSNNTRAAIFTIIPVTYREEPIVAWMGGVEIIV